MCKEIRAFRPKHIADGIANKMKAVRTKVDLSSVYIASPPSQEDVMEQVKEYLKKNHVRNFMNLFVINLVTSPSISR